MTSSTESVLLVQCCHLPQFFYLAKKLRQRHPEWNLSALVNDRPHVRSYLELFPPFDHLFFFDKNLPETLDAFDQILFPLLNRGYLRIKRAAWRLPGTAYEIDFQGERRALSPGTLVRSFARPLHRPPKEFVQYLEDFPPSPILSPILFFPTDEDSKAAEAIGRLHDPKVVSPQPIWVFCREDKRSFYQALPGVEEVRTYAPGRTWENLKAVLALARSRADVVSSIFSPQPAFRLQKLLFVLFPARHRLAFNQDLNCYYLKGRHGRRGQPSVWGTLLRVLLTRSRRGGRTTLFFPTDEDSKAAEAIGRLHDPKVVSPQPIWVFCREDKRSFYQALPGVEEVRTYAPGRTWENLKAVLALARSRADVVSSIFSPQPAFRLQKLLFVLFPARHRLAFNQDLNCYYLKGRHGRRGQPSVWGTLLRVLLTRSRRGGRTTLFFPTDEDSKAAEAIGRLHDPKIAAKSIVVFCREDKRSFYQALPTVEAVWTYAPGISLRHLKPWVRLLRTRVDLVCAVFSGRPIFLLQKFLFLTLRARNRLVFNEDLNCYMLRGHLAQFLQSQGGHRERGHSALIFAVRMALKGFLFVPRFLYLILWAAVVTVRARRRISKERRAANPSPDC